MMNSIVRGTTASNTFTLPFELFNPKQVWVTYTQHGVIKFNKDLTTIVANTTSIVVNLTQEDTLKLDEDSPVFIQLRILTDDDHAIASEIIETTVGQILKEGVI